MDANNFKDGLPDYFFLMLSELSPDVLASGVAPTGMPDYATKPPTAGFYERGLSSISRPDHTDLFKAAVAWRLSAYSPVSFGDAFSHGVDALANVRISLEGMFDFEKSLDDRTRRRVEDSIDRLALANRAMFSFLAETLGLTEDDLTARMNEIYNASFKKFAAEVAEMMR